MDTRSRNPDPPPDATRNVHADPTLTDHGEEAAQPFLDPASSRVGPYRLIRVLGEGGFGVVYLAEQASPQRRVAVKLLRSGVASPQTLSRFAHEAETLAMLQHPGIAQVFEAGFYDPRSGRTLVDDEPERPLIRRGLPFFAMEYIEGAPLALHARSHKLSRRARLELFIQVADAVQHAHTKGVIHRDLKPANILVDKAGRAKILDFGIARVTSDHSRRTMQTDIGQIVGTLGYMSPEQLAGDPAAVDTRADIYALGAILYELLAGHPPHRVEGKMLHEATRAICDQAPSRLGTIDRTLRGDLDTIVAKALEKEKTRRYQTAADLAADLRRYLADQPIVARPAGTWYQLRKFTRRNKALVGGVAASFALLTAGVVGTSYWAVRASAAERDEFTRRREAESAGLEARLQRDAARREADKARAVVQFLEKALSAADPEAKGRDVRLADVLDASVAEIDTTLERQPEPAAALRKAIAGAYKGLGLNDQAATQARRAVETLTKLHGMDHPDTLDARERLANIEVVQSMHAEAEAELKRIYEARVKRAGRDDAASLDTLSNLAALYASEGKLPEAEDAARRSLAGFVRLTGPDGLDAVSVKLQLGQILAEAGKTDEAEALIDESLRVRVRTLDPADIRIQNAREALGGLYRNQAKYAKAAEVYAATLESHKARYGPEHPKTLSKASDLGKALQQAGKLEEAAAILRETYDASVRINGPEHFDTLTAAGFLADTLQGLGRLAEAVEMRKQMAAGRAKTLGPDHPQTLIAHTNVAFVLMDLKRHDEAESVLRSVLEARQRTLGPDHPDVAVTYSLLGLNALKAGKPASAEAYMRPAVELREKILPDGNGLRGISMSQLGEALLLQDKAREAEPLIVQGAEWVLADPRVPLRNRRDAIDRAVRLYEKMGKGAEASSWRERLPVTQR